MCVSACSGFATGSLPDCAGTPAGKSQSKMVKGDGKPNPLDFGIDKEDRMSARKCLRNPATALPALILVAGTCASAVGGASAVGAKHFAWGHPAKTADAQRAIKIEAMDSMRFKPDHVTVKKGETVKFVIHNAGQLVHEFVLGPPALQKQHEKEMKKSGYGSHGGEETAEPNEVVVPAGQTRTLTWTFTKAGMLQYGCHEPGHFAAGMVGDITVSGS